MFRIVRENDSGKTKELLGKCNEFGGLYVCAHPEALVEKCHAYNIPCVFGMSYSDYLRKKDEYEDIPIYVDELQNLVYLKKKQDMSISEVEQYAKQFIPNLEGYTISI